MRYEDVSAHWLINTCVFQSELELVQSLGIPSEDIIYSGVCKQVSHIKYAAKNGIDILVCDNEAELRKISSFHPNAKYVLITISPLESCCCNIVACIRICHFPSS